MSTPKPSKKASRKARRAKEPSAASEKQRQVVTTRAPNNASLRTLAREVAEVPMLNAPLAAAAKAGHTFGASHSHSDVLHPDFEEYLAQMENPMAVGHGKIPFNPMGVATNSSFTHKSYNSVAYTTATNTALQVTLFPGHGDIISANPLDLESAHGGTQIIGNAAVQYVVGPAGDGTRNPAVGVVSNGNTLDTFQADSSTATSAAMTPAETAAFTASDSDGAHTRWRAQSALLIIENTTQVLNKGGDVVYVMPDHLENNTAVGTGMKFTSFRRKMDDVVVIPILFRSQDSYWWHSTTSGGAKTTMRHAAVKVCVNNTSGSTGSYRVSWLINWEVSGARYASFSTPTKDNAQAAANAVRTLNTVRNAHGDLTGITGHAAVQVLSTLPKSLVPAAAKAGLAQHIRTLAKSAPRAASGLVRAAASHLGLGSMGNLLGEAAGTAVASLL